MVPRSLESWTAAACSDAAYEFKAVDGCDLIWEHHEGATSVGIYSSRTHKGWHLLTFRGSEEFADWLINFSVWPRLDAALHRGYAAAWGSVHAEALEQLQELSITHLTCTGHSMGGSLATLAAFDLPFTSHLITFGSPKLASESMAARIEEKVPVVMRFVHGGDLCPLYPFALHQHVGAERRIGPERTPLRMLTQGLWDHDPKRYVQALAPAEVTAEVTGSLW